MARCVSSVECLALILLVHRSVHVIQCSTLKYYSITKICNFTYACTKMKKKNNFYLKILDSNYDNYSSNELLID